MITKRAVFMMWHKGQTIAHLTGRYTLSAGWVESAIRKYVARAYQ